MSTSSMTAAMTTAASVASGSCSNRPVRKSSVTTVSAAHDEAGELRSRAAPTPLTAVFERLPLTTIPLARPAARFAAPSPSSSRLASMS